MDRLPDPGANTLEPLAWILGGCDQALSHGLEPQDLALRNAGGPLLVACREGIGGSKAVVHQHQACPGLFQQSL